MRIPHAKIASTIWKSVLVVVFSRWMKVTGYFPDTKPQAILASSTLHLQTPKRDCQSLNLCQSMYRFVWNNLAKDLQGITRHRIPPGHHLLTSFTMQTFNGYGCHGTCSLLRFPHGELPPGGALASYPELVLTMLLLNTTRVLHVIFQTTTYWLVENASWQVKVSMQAWADAHGKTPSKGQFVTIFSNLMRIIPSVDKLIGISLQKLQILALFNDLCQLKLITLLMCMTFDTWSCPGAISFHHTDQIMPYWASEPWWLIRFVKILRYWHPIKLWINISIGTAYNISAVPLILLLEESKLTNLQSWYSSVSWDAYHENDNLFRMIPWTNEPVTISQQTLAVLTIFNMTGANHEGQGCWLQPWMFSNAQTPLFITQIRSSCPSQALNLGDQSGFFPNFTHISGHFDILYNWTSKFTRQDMLTYGQTSRCTLAKPRHFHLHFVRTVMIYLSEMHLKHIWVCTQLNNIKKEHRKKIKY